MSEASAGAPGACRAAEGFWSPSRLPRPHDLFPFDLFNHNAAKGLLDQHLEDELSYVRSHCMIPPFPWGQAIYHDFLVANVLRDNIVPGDLAEFGIGKGGTSVFLARLAKKYGRKCLAVDSFEGLPPPDRLKDNPYFVEGDYQPPAGSDNFQAFEQYKSVFDVDDTLCVVKGFFRDIDIPDSFESFSFVHMDSDLYESVYDSLEKVWDRLSPGGVVAVDDFFHHAQGPARAVSDFFRAREAEPPLLFPIPTYAVLLIKGQSARVGRQVSTEDSGSSRPVMFGPRSLDGNFYSFTVLRGCQAFLRAAEASRQQASEALRAARQIPDSEDIGAYARVHANAQSFCDFLAYPDTGSRSGCDIFRYLLPLEDLFDVSQGNLCGIPGEERAKMQIQV